MKNNITFKVSAKVISIIISSIGLILFTISSLKIENAYQWWNEWVKGLTNEIGGVLFSTGIISLLLEISSIQNSIANAIKGLVYGEIDFKKYTKDELEHILKKITIARLTNKTNELEINDSIYKYEKEIFKLIEAPYYDYHNCKTVLYPNSATKTFRKNVKIDYKLVNHSNELISPGLNWKVYVQDNKSQEEILKDFKICELKINDHTYNDTQISDFKKIKKIKKEHCDTYDYIITLALPTNNESVFKLNCIIDYEIPYDDVTQIYKMTKPCKRFLHEFYMKKDLYKIDEWKMSGTAFAAFYCLEEEEKPKFKVEQEVDESLSVSFKEWALPGAGYVILSEKI